MKSSLDNAMSDLETVVEIYYRKAQSFKDTTDIYYFAVTLMEKCVYLKRCPVFCVCSFLFRFATNDL